MLLRFTLTLFLATLSFAAQAQPRENSDAAVLARASLVQQTERVEVYKDGLNVDESLATEVDRLYLAIEATLGRPFDVETLGKKIKVVVSNNVRVSHVWRGYQHMSDPKAVIFLNSRAYEGVKSKSNSTFVHELTHLFTWKYNSHSLREGLADYVARAVMPNAAVGPNEANAKTVAVSWATTYLGSRLPAPPELMTDPEFRRNYYHLSFVLVKALIEKTSMAALLRFYDGPYSDEEFESVFKVKRLDLICQLKLALECKG